MTVFISILALLLSLPVLAAETSAGIQKPYFQMAVGEKRELAEKATNIKAGDSFNFVIEILGKPTFDQRLARKESGRLIGRSLKYYAVKWESGLVNELKDQLVQVFLDEHDRVTSVHMRLTLAE